MCPLLLADALTFPRLPSYRLSELVLLKRGKFLTKEQLRSELSL